MKVLMLSKACVVGSYQRKLEELARFDDVNLTVLVPPYWQDDRGEIHVERVHTNGYRLLVEDIVFNGNYHLHFYPGLGARVKEAHPDVLHIDEEPYNLATFHALWLGRRVGARCLLFTWQNLQRQYPPPFSWMERYVLNRVNHIIAGNREAVGVLRSKGYTGPTQVIPQFGVDPDQFKHLPDIEEKPSFTVGYAGRLVREKGLHHLLQAAAGLEGPWRLLLLGDGPFRSELTQLAKKLTISDRVTFNSPIASTAMPRYLNQLDVLVLPSRTQSNWKEQFGRVLIEAMACEIPVVGSSCGEIPNVIGDAGLIFPEGNTDELREQLRRLKDDPSLREELGRRGRQRVLDRYTQAQVARATHEVYQALF